MRSADAVEATQSCSPRISHWSTCVSVHFTCSYFRSVNWSFLQSIQLAGLSALSYGRVREIVLVLLLKGSSHLLQFGCFLLGKVAASRIEPRVVYFIKMKQLPKGNTNGFVVNNSCNSPRGALGSRTLLQCQAAYLGSNPSLGPLSPRAEPPRNTILCLKIPI